MKSTHQGLASLTPWAGALALAFCLPGATALAQFEVREIASGLAQPIHVAQAPGDLSSLYIVERVSPTSNLVSGPVNIGQIRKLDLATGTSTTFLDPTGTVDTFSDAGLMNMAFHPDFQTNGKFYITTAIGSTATNRVDEYVMSGSSPTFSRTILQYSDATNQDIHLVQYIGFKPGAVGNERNELYITTGDGGPQASSTSYVNKAQNPTEIFGKVLRVDISPGATYPGSVPAGQIKNYGIPASNNAGTHTVNGVAATVLPEVIAQGLRNPFGVSFDSQGAGQGDMYIGDVGFNAVEEVNFIKSNIINSTPTELPDFGWPRREGPIATVGARSGIAGVQGNSINPITFRTHTSVPVSSGLPTDTDDQCIIGGFVYHGPIAELNGKYIFSDFMSDRIFAINFDRDTTITDFGGQLSITNNNGVTNWQDITTMLNSSLVGADPLTEGLWKISHFFEDANGDMYLVKYANTHTNSFAYYTANNQGQIFKLVAVPEPSTLALAALAAPLFYLACKRRRSKALAVAGIACSRA